MSDSYEDYFQPRFEDASPSIAALQADVSFWREAARHMLQVKGSCGCLGRAEKLWCRRCRIMDRYETETGEKCR